MAATNFLLYCSVNCANGKYYIGVHNDTDHSYLGSGHVIRAAVKKYGVECFVRLTIDEFDNEEAAYFAEAALVTSQFIAETRGQCYNSKPGGRGGWTPKHGDDNPMRRPEVAAKVSAAVKAAITPEERERRSIRMSEMRRSGRVKSPGGHGFDRTGMAPWNKGKILPKGKTYSMSSKTCPHCQLVGKGGVMTRYHFDNCKHKRTAQTRPTHFSWQ